MRGVVAGIAVLISVLCVSLLIGIWMPSTTAVAGQDENRKIELYDNCDPGDPGWAGIGGCDLDPTEGDVSLAEFGQLLLSPLALSVVGHPSWRIEPSYMSVDLRKSLRIINEGGREHTFTEVADFGGGRIAGLSSGLTPAPECQIAPGAVDPTLVGPEQSLEVGGLDPGLHKFQCCFHPWMRAAVRVEVKH
jgi:hypothetical protein